VAVLGLLELLHQEAGDVGVQAGIDFVDTDGGSIIQSAQQAAGVLAHSPILPVHGSRSAAALAAEFAFFAAKIHPDVRLLSGSRTEVLDALMRAIQSGASAIFTVSMPRHPRELIEVLELGSRRLIRPTIATYPLARALQAYHHLDTGVGVGRQVIVPSMA